MAENKKKELDVLRERKAKADAMYASDSSKIPLAQMKTYLAITERIHVLEDIKFMVNTAPESMNPNKFNEHATYVLAYIKRMCFSDALKEFYLKNEANIKNFAPKAVSDYKKMISSFLIDFLKIWKSEKNYK